VNGHYNPFPTFPYTGSLRPVYPLSPKREVPDSIAHPDYAKDGIPRSERKWVGRNNIAILDKKQQDGMRKACRLGREVLDIAARAVKPGVTTDHIDKVVHEATLERDVRDPAAGPWHGKHTDRNRHTHLRSTMSTSPSPYARRSTKLSATEFPISGFYKTETLST
jgi:hypothetical protein